MSSIIGTTQIGTVASKAGFGVLVKIPGIASTGLLHVSRMRGNSHDLQRERLAAIVVGDEIFVDVLDVQKKSNGTLRIMLSEKQIHDDLVLHHIPLNEPLGGVVIGKSEYGVFVSLLGWYVSGLLHVSRMEGETRRERDFRHAKMEIGDELTVYVREVLLRDCMLRLSLTEIQKDPSNVQITFIAVDEAGREVPTSSGQVATNV